MKRVGVVLVNWNGGALTRDCLATLLAGSRKPDHVVLVDNGSTDASLYLVEQQFSYDIEVIKNATNTGFSVANNQGIARLLTESIDFIWILNNDTLVAVDCLEQLVHAASEYPDVAAYSGQIFYAEDPTRLWYAGAVRNNFHLAPKHLSRLPSAPQAPLISVPFISGCCMFVPRDIFHRCGGFVETYFAYSEDNEWCWRVTNSGRMLAVVPKAVLWHRVSASVRQNETAASSNFMKPKARFLTVRNHTWAVRSHAQGSRKALAIFGTVLVVSRILLRCAMKRDFEGILAAWRGLVSGLGTKPPVDYPRWCGKEVSPKGCRIEV